MRCRNRTCRSYVLKNSGRHFVVTLTCGFFTSGYLERFPVTGVSLIPRDFRVMYYREPRLCQIRVKRRLPETGRTGPATGAQPGQTRLVTDLGHDHVRFVPVPMTKIRDKRGWLLGGWPPGRP